MDTYLRITFWVRIVLTPASVAVVVWGIVTHDPLLIIAGIVLLLSMAMFFVGYFVRRRGQVQAGRR